MANFSTKIIVGVLFLTVWSVSAQARNSGRRTFNKSAFQKAMSQSERDHKQTSHKAKKHRQRRAEEGDSYGDNALALEVSGQLDVQAAHSGPRASSVGFQPRKRRIADQTVNEDFELELRDSAQGLTESDDEALDAGAPHRHMAAEAVFED